MKKLLIMSALVASATASPLLASKPFQGGYVGVVTGYGMNKNRVKQSVANVVNDASKFFKNPKGFLAGLNLGYGYQPTPCVYMGVDLSVNLVPMKGSKSQTIPGGQILSTSVRETFSSALMFQLGRPFGNFLPYVEMGTQLSCHKVSRETNHLLVVRENKTRFGFAAGSGLKYKFANVTLSLGYRYARTVFAIKDLRFKINGHKFLFGVAYTY